MNELQRQAAVTRWGDMGRLYLWITNEDLAARNFENCWLILQCG